MLCCMSVSQNTGRKVKAGRLRLPSQPGLHKEKLSQTEVGGGGDYMKKKKRGGEKGREKGREGVREERRQEDKKSQVKCSSSWLHTAVIPAVGGWGREIINSRPAWAAK